MGEILSKQICLKNMKKILIKCEKKILAKCDKNNIILEKFGKIKYRLQD